MDGLILRSPAPGLPLDDEPLIKVSASHAAHAARPDTPAALHPASPHAPPSPAPASSLDLSSEAGILAALRSHPAADTVTQILALLASDASSFNVRRAATSFASQAVQCLVSAIIPAFWPVLSAPEKQLLATCLHSPIGLGSVAARLNALLPAIKAAKGLSVDAQMADVDHVLSLLQMILGRSGVVLDMWNVTDRTDSVKRGLFWKEYCALVAGGRLLGIAAEAEHFLGRSTAGPEKRWVGDGRRWAAWLGKELAAAVKGIKGDDDAGWASLGSLLATGFRLGYTDVLVEHLTFGVARDAEKTSRLQNLLFTLPAHEKRSYLLSLIRLLAQQFTNMYTAYEDEWWAQEASQVSGAGALLSTICSDNGFKSLLVEWITASSGGGIGQSIGIRRAALLVVTQDPFTFQEVFDKSLNQFSDKLWIRHTPIMRQEVLTQFLLLFAGHSHRRNPALLKRLTRSSTFLNAVSNRLNTSSQRARFLGMIVAESFSGFIDDEKNRMSFGTGETDTEEATWWKSISDIDDKIGSIQDLFKKKPRAVVQLQVGGSAPSTAAEIQPNIQPAREDEDTDNDDDEFTPYTNPEPDHYDSPSEDATTIDRSKPQPPVYIRTLITYLHNSTSYDHQYLALTHAASLIRRKLSTSSTVRELTSHLPELLSLLVGLHNNFEIKEFPACQISAIVALVIVEPVTAGQLLARMVFKAREYSIQQRCNMLTAIGLAARELAGMETGLPDPTGFAIEAAPESRRLPERAHRLWTNGSPAISDGASALPGSYLEPLSNDLQSALLRPIAQNAVAETKEGTVASMLLKENSSRRFSSRLTLFKNSATRPQSQHRKILDVVSSAFFLPLTGGFWVALHDNTSVIVGSGVVEDIFLSTLLRTLALLMHSAGPAAPGLDEMTTELWSVVKAARVKGGRQVTEAGLLAVLTALEINTEVGVEGRRRVVETWGKEVVEVREWVEGILTEGDGEEGEVRVLAAAVAVKIQDVVEGFQRLFLGEMMSVD